MKHALYVLTCLALLLSANTYAEEGEKKYTQKDFDAAIAKRLKRFTNDGLVELSKEMMKKEQSLQLKEAELKRKEDALNMTSQDLQKRLKEFQASQNKFLGCLDKNKEEQGKRITHMVSTVSGMKPKTAAEVLSVQDADIAVEILGRLKPEKVSKIFNLMKKEVSARLQKQYLNMKK